jgi:hypothetical protein
VTLAAFSKVKLQYVSPAYKVKIGQSNSICISTKQIISSPPENEKAIFSEGDGRLLADADPAGPTLVLGLDIDLCCIHSDN